MIGAPGSHSGAGQVYLWRHPDFGNALAVGDVQANGSHRVVIGAPGAQVAFVLKEALFADGFQVSVARWSAWTEIQ